MSDFTEASAVIDPSWGPKVTLTRDAGGTLTATLEVEGLAPQRLPNSEEQGAGITSFDPVTVFVGDSPVRKETCVGLVKIATRALWSAIASTDGATPTAKGLSMIALRTSMAVSKALREIDEDV